MLDDLKYIHDHDSVDTLGIAERQWQQLLKEFEAPAWSSTEPIVNIVFAGMGGSALAAVVSRSWPTVDLPFEVVRDYDLPSYVGVNSLVIVSSYSGNTEETLNALTEAEAKGAQIAVITGGGKLAEIAKTKNYPVVILPDAGQPRYAVLYSVKALLVILRAANVLPQADARFAELTQAAEFLKQSAQAWIATVPAANNRAKQIAQEIMGKSLVVYAGPKLFPAAYKWKISANENAKHIAWVNQYPEFNHNEFIGWTKQPVDKPYAVVDLRSQLEHPRIQKRFEVSERLLSGSRPAPIVVDVQGETLLEQLLWAIALGDFVTLYLALLSGLDPAPVDLIEKFKQSLDQ